MLNNKGQNAKIKCFAYPAKAYLEIKHFLKSAIYNRTIKYEILRYNLTE